MSELLTTNERISKLEEKIDRAIKLLNPESDQADPNIELFGKFEQFKDEMKAYLADFKSSSNVPDDIEQEEKNFYRNMWNYALIGFSSSAILTILTYKFVLFFFPLAFSLFFAFSLISLGLLHDKYLLPGNTIRRIASNAISASIFWLAFTIASVAGFSIGNSIISDPFGGEERGSTNSSNKQEQIRYNDDTSTPANSIDVPVGSGEASEQ